MTRFSGPSVMMWALALSLTLTQLACRPPLDDPQPAVKAPKTLPVFGLDTPKASITQRAQELADEATPALASKQWAVAIPKLTEALALDSGQEDARYRLAQAFVQAGLGSVALKLLEPLKTQKDCGWCIERLQQVKTAPEFERFAKSEQGAKLLADVPTTVFPYATWAKALVAIIQHGKFEEMDKWAHASRSFAVARSCPTCPNPAVRTTPTRTFVGPLLLTKVLSRFDSRTGGIGTPLNVQGEPTCVDRCCKWKVPEPVPAGEAAVAEICLRPDKPDQPTLTRISLVFAPAPAAMPTPEPPAAVPTAPAP